MSITSDQLDLFDFEEEDNVLTEEQKIEARRKYRREHKSDPRKITAIPIKNGERYCIVPEVAPIIDELARRAARDIAQEEATGEAANGLTGINILAARAAVVMRKKEQSVVRRLYAISKKRQLFISTNFVEACLMAMDAEHEFEYGVWPSCRADALEIVADFAEGRYGPDKLLKKANRLYDKGLRKALKRSVELVP